MKTKANPSLFLFSPGQLIIVKKYGYRGVIIEMDDGFQGPEEHYEEFAEDNPSRDEPWYHILVDGADYVTYVPESVLQADSSMEPISHPRVADIFHDFQNGKYLRQLH